jgi:hypothetical protein
MKQLLAAAQERKQSEKTSNVLGAFDGANGNKAITVKRRGKRDLTIELNKLGVKSKEEALELVKKAVETFF